MERVAIFIDGSNLYKGLVQHLGSDYRLNFVEFITLLTAGRKLLRAYVTVRLGRLERRADGFVEKGVDIQIAVDMLRLAFVNAYDIAVLVSGDGDFAEVVRVVQDLGKQVENTTFHALSSHRLAQQADHFYPLDDFPWERLRAQVSPASPEEEA